jgi:hypothetical protein
MTRVHECPLTTSNLMHIFVNLKICIFIFENLGAPKPSLKDLFDLYRKSIMDMKSVTQIIR